MKHYLQVTFYRQFSEAAGVLWGYQQVIGNQGISENLPTLKTSISS